MKEHMSAQQAKFAVPFNWSEAFLEFICANPQHVASVYGSLPGYPGGRPIPHTSLEPGKAPDNSRLSRTIETLRKYGIDFHFVYNMSCTGNTLLTDVGMRRLVDEVKGWSDLGIRHITVSNFGLGRMISKINPDIEITM